jgi:hypothetical protein
VDPTPLALPTAKGPSEDRCEVAGCGVYRTKLATRVNRPEFLGIRFQVKSAGVTGPLLLVLTIRVAAPVINPLYSKSKLLSIK